MYFMILSILLRIGATKKTMYWNHYFIIKLHRNWSRYNERHMKESDELKHGHSEHDTAFREIRNSTLGTNFLVFRVLFKAIIIDLNIIHAMRMYEIETIDQQRRCFKHF